MNIRHLLYILTAIILIGALAPNIHAAGQWLPKGSIGIQGPCNHSVTITVRGYQAGYLNNPAYLDVEETFLTNNGYYAGNIPESGSDLNLDFIAIITNVPCDPNIRGNTTLLNRPDPVDPFFTDVDFSRITAGYDISLTSPEEGASVSNNRTTFSWSSNGGGLASYSLIIDDTPDLSSPLITQTGITNLSYTLTGAQVLPDNTYYWAIRAHLDGYALQDTGIRSYALAASGLSIDQITPADGSWQSNPVEITATTNLEAVCRYSFVSGSFSGKTLMTGVGTTHSSTVTLPSEGSNTLFVQCNSSLGLTGEYQRTLKLDEQAPLATGATVIIAGGATYSNSTTLTFTWSGFTDPQPGSNVSTYYYNFSDEGGTTRGISDPSSPGQITNARQGIVRVYVWAADAAGNIGSSAWSDIIVDTQPPIFGTPYYSPTVLSKYTTGNFRVCSIVTEVSPFYGGAPTFRYRIGTDSWSARANMSVIEAGWCYTISEPSGGWSTRAGEILHYYMEAQDIHGRYSNLSSETTIYASFSPPVMSPLNPVSVLQGATLRINITATDIDGDILYYSSNLSEIVITKINNTLAEARWTPTNTHVGVNAVRFTVSDGLYNDSEVALIAVINVNDNPIVQTIADQYVHEYTLFNYTINATDPDGDSLIYRTNSSRFSPNSQTGSITYTPTYQDRGIHPINVTVSDGRGGYASTTFKITVGYCGDGVCRAEYETYETCQLDCSPATLESAAIVIEPRNCLNVSMSIFAAKLVMRATCDTKGIIIDDMEVCGALPNTALRIEKIADGIYQTVEDVTTDSEGYAYWIPDEEADYRIIFQSTYSHYALFTSRACTQDEKDSQIKKQEDDKDTISSPGTQPSLELPTEILPEEQSSAASLIYFLILPFLLIILIVTVMRYVYVFEKRNPESKYASFIDTQIYTGRKKMTRVLDSIKNSKHMGPSYLKIFNSVTKAIAWTHTITDTIIHEKTYLLSKITQKKSLKIPYFDMEGIVHQKKNQLLLLSIVKYFRPKEQSEKTLEKIEHKIDLVKGIGFSKDLSLIDIGTICANLSLRARYEKNTHSLLDIRFNLINNYLCVADIIYSSPFDPATFIRAAVIINGYDEHHVYVHNYAENKKNLKIPHAQFEKAWKNAGRHLLLILGKK